MGKERVLPVIRQDPATRLWSIIATERAKRPHDFGKNREVASNTPSYDRHCPFCAGNEAMTPPAVVEFPAPGGSGPASWGVRVVPNKFPALMTPDGKGDTTRRMSNCMYLEMDGVGRHEVVIESPDHSKTIATLSDDEVAVIVRTYRDRFLELDKSPWNQLIIVFRNQGEQAGTSLAHPHSQIIGTPIVPEEIRRRLEESQRYYDDRGTCVYCDILDYELAEKTRIVCSNSCFVALCPFASSVPYEVWIVPRRHASSFGVLSDDEIPMLGKILRDILKRLHDLLGNPDYNYVVRSAPHHSAMEPHFHWYVELLPRLTTRAGFEIGSGININVVAPEDAAEQLRGAG
jgi:UDPglucose--hexose-1-phosphate uridylyltransferase